MRTYYWVALALCALGISAAQAGNPRNSLGQVVVEDQSTSPEINLVAHQSFTAMEQRLQALESRLDSVETAGYYDGDEGDVAYDSACCGDGCECGSSCSGCGDCCNDCWCHTCSGFTANAELLFLRLHDSEADDPGDDYDTASRTTIGYMDNCGREWRVRYFEYATEIDNDDYQQMEYIDAEYAGRFTLGCNWRGELSGGLRWAQFDESDELQYSDTIGPVLGAMFYGPCIYGLDTFAGIRQSWQFGTPFENDNVQDFGTFSVTEVQLGTQYNTCVCGNNAYVRGLFEVQKWEGASNDDTQDVGLMGFGFAAGMTR